MSFEKLNKLADAYFSDRSQDAFRKLYDEARLTFQTHNRKRICGSGYGNINDADEILDDVILKLTSKQEVSGFGSQMSTALRNARVSWYRKEKARTWRFELTVDSAPAEDAPVYEIPDDKTTEDIVLEKCRKKRADQRQLIDSLVSDPSKVDFDTVRAVSEFPQYDSITALAKALGMHHEVVKRKLRRLASRYDANRFGDVREYLAV